MKRALLLLAALPIIGVLAGAATVALGLYDVSATDQHLAPTYRLLDTAMRRAIVRRAQAIEVPPLADATLQRRGAALFDAHCATCHGAPGLAPEAFALGLTPAPANLVHTARTWLPAELYWVIRNGIKMTGMPAWEHRLGNDELWAIVAFLQQLPLLAPADYQALVGRHPRAVAHKADVPALHGDVVRGRRAIAQYACVTCHAIPGIVGPNAAVGPPLAGLAQRRLIAGRLPNTPANLVRWLKAPQALRPGSAMPDLGLTDQHASDIAAYLIADD